MSIATVKHDGDGGFFATLDDGVEMHVPNDPANRWYAEITRRSALDPGDPAFLAISAADPPPPPPTDDEIYDAVIQNQKVLKAVVLSLNDGTLVPGANKTGADLKAIVKANM